MTDKEILKKNRAGYPMLSIKYLTDAEYQEWEYNFDESVACLKEHTALLLEHIKSSTGTGLGDKEFHEREDIQALEDKIVEYGDKADEIKAIGRERYIAALVDKELIIHDAYFLVGHLDIDFFIDHISLSFARYFAMNKASKDKWEDIENVLIFDVNSRLCEQHFACEKYAYDDIAENLKLIALNKARELLATFTDEQREILESYYNSNCNRPTNEELEQIEAEILPPKKTKKQTSKKEYEDYTYLYQDPTELPFYRTPATRYTNRMTDILSYMSGGQSADEIDKALRKYQERNRAITHKDNLTIKKGTRRVLDENTGKLKKVPTRQFEYADKGSSLNIQIADIENLTNSNKTLKKIFRFILNEVFNQCYNNKQGNIYNSEVVFSVNDMVAAGLYSSPNAARRAFADASETFKAMFVTAREDDEQTTRRYETAPLFNYIGFKDTKSDIRVSINAKEIDWAMLIDTYTIIPNYCFTLSIRGFDLLDYIFYLARQNGDKIKENGYFTISLRTIQSKLNLPNEKDTKDTNGKIKKPIHTVIEEINNNEQNTANSFKISIIADMSLPIREYLDKGKLKIEFTGLYRDYFSSMESARERIIDHNVKRKQRIIDKAAVEREKKRLENTDN